MKYRWSVAKCDPAQSQGLGKALNIDPVVAACLLNRGYSTASAIENFLNPKLRSLAEPFVIPNMHRAVERLLIARERNEPFVIFGDYDVDGVTATALLVEFFSDLGWHCNYYLPHRLDEGYGLSRDGVENCLARHNVKLLLAVDCGSTATNVIAELASRGIDVLVLDHHQLSTPAPAAHAIVNPQLLCAGEPEYRDYCSVGLAFKLAHACLKKMRDNPACPEAASHDLRGLLDLVALGTIADLVPLNGENRILVSAGLKRIDEGKRPGIKALRTVARIESPIESDAVAFYLAPRLNSAGRMESALDALKLLLAKTEAEAMPYAQQLDNQNRERQAVELKIFSEVRASLQSSFNAENDYIIVEGQAEWHPGVVGIVAARILREFNRPTIILGGDGSMQLRGSGRSIAGLDLARALRECGDCLVRHGGHAMAAGLSLATDMLPVFRERLNSFVRQQLTPEQFQPVLGVDCEVPFSALTHELVLQLEKLKPFGQANSAIHFVSRGVRAQGPVRRFGNNNRHARFSATDGSASQQIVWWNCPSDWAPPERFDLAFTPEQNEYNGQIYIRLKLLDHDPATVSK